MSESDPAESATSVSVIPAGFESDSGHSLFQKWCELRSELRSGFARQAAAKGDPEAAQETGEPLESLEERLVDMEKRLMEKVKESEEDAKRLQELHTLSAKNREELMQLKQENEHLRQTTDSLQRESDKVARENEDLTSISQRRQDEINQLHDERKTLVQRLSDADSAKYEALMRSEDVVSKEKTLEFREKRLAEDRQLMEHYMENLRQDLHESNEKASAARREKVEAEARYNELVVESESKIKLLDGKVQALGEDKEHLFAQVEELTERLKNSKDDFTAVEEGYRQEIRSKSKLADLHEVKARDEQEKSLELQKAVEELQNIVRESSERYAALEDNLEKERAENQTEMKRRNDTIRSLNKELEDSKSLIQTLEHRGLTEEGISKLSPAAAAASKLIKSGMSLTQVYSQLVTAQEELLAAQDENRRLNTYMEEIINDISDRAPALKREREEYVRMLDHVKTLENSLNETRDQNEDDRTTTENAKRRLGHALKDNEKLKKQVKDLGQQVTVLLKEVEAARFGNTTSLAELEAQAAQGPKDADSVISQRLVVFRNIEELQKTNAELLAVVRQMSESQEKAEAQLVEEKTTELKLELDHVKLEVEELREARRRQEVLADNLIVQRDMYKSMAESKPMDTGDQPAATSTPGLKRKEPESSPAKSMNAYRDMEVKSAKAESALLTLDKEFKIYREEKCENERIITEQLDQTRKELNEARAKAIKLASKEEWNTERFKLAQANAGAYKREIGLLEERNKSLSSVVAKHELSIETFQKEFGKLESQLNHAERDRRMALAQNENLKTLNERLKAETEILHNQRSGSQLLADNLKMVQLELSKADSQRRMKLENENDALKQEMGLLRKKVEQENADFIASMKAWESTQAELRTQLDQSKESTRSREEELAQSNAEIEALRQKMTVYDEKLKLLNEQAASGDKMTAAESLVSAELTQGKLVDLQSQLNAAKNENVKLKDNLASARQATQQYKQLADAAEKQVVESNAAAAGIRQNHDKAMAALASQVEALQNRLRELEQSGEGGVLVTEQLKDAQSQLSAANSQLSGLRELAESLKVELNNQKTLAVEVRERYERELSSHGQTAQTVVELRQKLGDHVAKARDLEQAKTRLEDALREHRDTLAANQASTTQEVSMLKNQFELVKGENATLHTQLSNLSTQLAKMREPTQSSEEKMSRSFTEDDAKSSEQLMEIVKYMKHGKELLEQKVEAVQAESIRLKAQLETALRELEEAQSALNLATESGKKDVLPSAKYSELMEKVETLPAINDSNRILRNRNEKLELEVVELSEKLNRANDEAEPLKSKLKDLEEEMDKATAEMAAVKADNQRWKARVSQLIEKHQKISPEEMKKVQILNSNLQKNFSQQQVVTKQLQDKCSVFSVKLKQTEEKLAAVAKERDAEVQRLTSESQSAKTLNQQLGQKVSVLTKRAVDAENGSKALMAERDNLKKEIESKTAETSAEVTALKAENEKLKSSSAQLGKVRTLARSFKDKHEKLSVEHANQTKELEDLRTEHEKVKDDLKRAQESNKGGDESGAESSSAGATNEEATTLIAESFQKIAELEEKVRNLTEEGPGAVIEKLEDDKKKLAEENEGLKDKHSRMLGVIKGAKTKVEDLEAELKTSKAESEQLKGMVEQIKTLQSQLEETKANYEAALSKIEAMKQQKPSPKTAKSAADKVATEAVTASVKPVIASTSAQPRKQSAVQPQAHVPPTTRQTASIRPTAVRAATRAAATAPEPQPVSVVEPLSNSPTTTAAVSAMPQRLNPAAADFVPATSVAGTEDAEQQVPVTESDVAVVQPSGSKRTRDDEGQEDASKRPRVSVQPEVQQEQPGEEVVDVDSSDEEINEEDVDSAAETDGPEDHDVDEDEEEEGEVVDDDDDDGAGGVPDEFDSDEQADDDVVVVESSDDERDEEPSGASAVGGATRSNAVVPEGSEVSQDFSRASDPRAPEDDSVVPSAPKPTSQTAAATAAAATAVQPAAQPSTSSFEFEDPAAGAPSGNLAAQEGVDRTAVDISQLAASGERPAAAAAPVSAGPIPVVASGSRVRITRRPIVWNNPSGGPPSAPPAPSPLRGTRGSGRARRSGSRSMRGSRGLPRGT